MNNDLISREALKITIEQSQLVNAKLSVYDVLKIIDNAPIVEPQKVVTIPHELIEKLASCVVDTIRNIDWDKAIEAYKERPQGETVIRCKDCKYQKKYWHEDKRMKEKGYWIYGCALIDDPFIGTPVWGGDNQFCSSAQKRGNKNDSRTNT